MYWWLNHSPHGLEDELRCTFIFAPLADGGGKDPGHWRRLDEVATGDVIFAFTGSGAHAVLIATTACQRVPYPVGFRHDADLGGRPEGRGFSVDWHALPTAVPTAEIVALAGTEALQGPGLPLDKNGNRKQGYLWSVPTEVGARLLERLLAQAG